MTPDSGSERIVVELTLHEAMTVAAALQQYEPYWSPSLDDASRIELLEHIREHVDGVRHKLGWAPPVRQ